jgi:antitoxin (DNA-binding transcriptional repressor) of toxin-antitoxin stability system
LASLLDRTERGESFVITRHCRPVAHLVPAADTRDQQDIDAAIIGLKEFAASHILDVDWKALRDTGRKW